MCVPHLQAILAKKRLKIKTLKHCVNWLKVSNKIKQYVKKYNHIISACVNIGLPVNIDRGVNIGCDTFLHLL